MDKKKQKPVTTKEQINLIWEAVFNHIPSQLHWQDIKINFILVFVALILGMLTFLGIAFMVGK